MTTRRDDGFSLVEVILAIFLLAMISLGVLPLIVSATSSSVANKDLETATAFLNSQIAGLRDEFPLGEASRCSVLQARATPPSTLAAGPAGTGMSASIRVLDPCPTEYPAAVQVVIAVSDSEGETLVEVATGFWVSSYDTP